MTGPRAGVAIQWLHWTVGLVVLLESWRTFYAAYSHLQLAGHAGSLQWLRLILSGAEMVAAVLFLLPSTMAAGGYALLAIFGLAILIHGLHGEFGGLEILVLYGVAVYVCITDRQDPASPAPG